MNSETNSAPSRQISSITRANTLADLKKVWASKFKKRADGGWWALSGFSLQMMAALERMLKRELIDKKPRGEVDIEAVSDAILTEGKTCLVQIKRTLTKATLEAAFAEAYDIASLCSDELRNDLRFQVLAIKRETTAVLNAALAHNALRERTTIDQTLLQRTLTMFDATAPILIAADPTQALRSVLWNAGVENPSATMEAMLGGIFAAFDGRNRAGVQDALIRALDKAKSDVRVARLHGGHLFVPGDLQIVSTAPGGTILVDASPRMPDLKMGRFLERANLLERAFAAATRWEVELDAHIAAQLSKMPVFCIRGRSGDGKSVLMLQLVASLLERRAIATITGLASFDDLRLWLRSRPKVQPGDIVDGVDLAYIDDLPRRTDAAAIAELIGESFAFGSPSAALLTCGITEDLPKAPCLQFDFFNMPPPNEQDQQMFGAWLGGAAPQPFDPRRSLATMLTDLRRPSANEAPLADQLESELSRQGSWPAARHVIAANLFGIPGAVPLNQTAALGEFSFKRSGIILRADWREGGFELGHAEYLEPIYRHWLGAADFPRGWGRDLGLAIAAALRRNEPRLARMLLGSMVNVGAMRSRLSRLKYRGEQPVVDLLNAAFEALQAEVDDAAMAPVMRLWLVAQRATNGGFRGDLEARAVALIDKSEVAPSAKAEIAVQLASPRTDGEQDTACRIRALAYLEAADDEPIVIAYYKRLALRLDADQSDLVHKWLTRHQRSLSVAPILSTMIRAGGPHAAKYRMMAFHMIGNHPKNTGLIELVRILVQDSIESSHFESISRWLAHPHPPRDMSTIYAQLLKAKGGRRYLSRAFTWLEQNIQALGTHDLLAQLIRMQPDHDLGPLVDSWIDAHLHDPGRYTVVGALLTHPQFERAALQLALELIAGTDRNEHTRYLTAVSIPVVKAMTSKEVYSFAKTLPLSLHKYLNLLRRARR